MKKKNLALLFLVSILTLGLFTGLLAYAFDLQAKKDAKENATQENLIKEETTVTGIPTDTEGTAEVTPTQGASTEDDAAAGEDETSPEPDATSTADAAADNDFTDNDQGTVSVTPLPDAAANIPYSELPNSGGSDGDTIVLGFAGDVNLDEAYYPVAKYDAEGKDITGCFSQDILEEMNNADIMMINNEFAYSTRGTKEEDKSYTFRANPDRVEILTKMGVDIVSLANNHALDYGPDALEDTFDTLEGAGIEYIGAGNNLDRAKAPVYYKIGDKTIAYVAASRVVFDMSWYAAEDKLGMIGTYDPTLILGSIREAAANSDFVVIFVHWGVERNSYPEDYQRNMAKQYIDAGADAVIGCHPHVMQGMEFYKGKPIVYSLGNYWFNKSTKESGMIKLYLNSDASVKVQLLPAMNQDTFTYLLTDTAEKKNYYDFIQSLSYNVNIDEDGYLTLAE